MSAYIEPTFDPDELVDARACWARAQRVLEEAELNLGRVVQATGGNLDRVSDATAYAEAQARIGQGWAALGAALRGVR